MRCANAVRGGECTLPSLSTKGMVRAVLGALKEATGEQSQQEVAERLVELSTEGSEERRIEESVVDLGRRIAKWEAGLAEVDSPADAGRLMKEKLQPLYDERQNLKQELNELRNQHPAPIDLDEALGLVESVFAEINELGEDSPPEQVQRVLRSTVQEVTISPDTEKGRLLLDVAWRPEVKPDVSQGIRWWTRGDSNP